MTSTTFESKINEIFSDINQIISEPTTYMNALMELHSRNTLAKVGVNFENVPIFFTKNTLQSDSVEKQFACSLKAYREFLIKKSATDEQTLAVKTAEKLKQAITLLLTEKISYAEREEAILAFDKQARNSNLSKSQLQIISTVVAGLIGLVLTVVAPADIAVLSFLSALAIGFYVGMAILQAQETKAGNSEILSDLNYFNKHIIGKDSSYAERFSQQQEVMVPI